MDPEGNTKHLISSFLDNSKMEISNTLVQRKDSVESMSSASEVDERRHRISRNQAFNLSTRDIPQSVQTTYLGDNIMDTSTIGRDGSVSLCNASEKCTLSRDCSVDSVFRNAQCNLSITNNSIELFSTRSFNNSDYHNILSHSNDDDDETTIYLCEEGSFSIDEGDSIIRFAAPPSPNSIVQSNSGENIQKIDVCPSTSTAQLRYHLLGTIKIKSFVIGILLGLLMQFSSLGINFLASSKSRTALEAEQPSESMTFLNVSEWKFFWSAFTSLLGLVVMSLLRVMITDIDSNTSPVLIHMEGFISVGALVGICIAWILVDYLLHVEGHLILSLLTLGGSLVWYKILSVLQVRRAKADTTRSSMKEPLLPQYKEEIEDSNVTATMYVPQVKLIGIMLGFVIGVLVQFSSLGANFMLQVIHTMHAEGHASQPFVSIPLDYLFKTTNENRDRIVTICFVWSFVTSLIGIVLLLAIRYIVSNIIILANLEKTTVLHYIVECQHTMILQFECFYALGSILGLNTAWAYTDFILGINSHFTQSICALVASLIWCFLFLCCTSSRVV